MSGTLRAGVIGFPIAHSRSPAIHRAWIEALGLDAAYDAIETPPQALADFVERHRGGGVLKGVNVTIPHKEAALTLADIASDTARQAGAANVLIFRSDGVVEARNTDGAGMLEAFRIAAPGFRVHRARVLVLGAGGAARGAVAALAQAGAAQIVIVNRTFDKAQALADAFAGNAVAAPYDILRAEVTADAVINATSQGLGSTQSPRLNWPVGGRGRVAMDMVYKDETTPFLADAKARGWDAVEGLEMLIGQAAPSFEAFYGAPPPPNYRALALAAVKRAP